MTQVFCLLPLLNEAKCARGKGEKPRKKKVGAGNHGHSKRKLTNTQCLEIKIRSNSRNCIELANEYGVSPEYIKKIASGVAREKFVVQKRRPPLTKE